MRSIMGRGLVGLREKLSANSLVVCERKPTSEGAVCKLLCNAKTASHSVTKM